MNKNISFSKHTFPLGEYLSPNQQYELKAEMGIMKWIALNAFEVKLEGAVCEEMPVVLEFWAIKDSKGVFIDYVHGFLKKQYFIHPNNEMK